MKDSRTRNILRINNLLIILYYCLLLTDCVDYVYCKKEKRQIFRENLLPERGGKIPESAFHPERLLLNRLNQQGISIPDGTIPQQRRQEKHPYPKQALPETLKVTLKDDGRYVAPPGRYHYDKQPTVDTTYLVRIPHKYNYKGVFANTNPVRFANSWKSAAQGTATQYFKQNDVAKWKPPVWYNEIANNKWKNKDITDPSQVLSEFWQYLQKLHRDYDK